MPNPLALPGQNLTQQKMGQSINVFCPTVSSIAMPTPGQRDLGNLCSAMIGNSFGLSMSGLNGALSQLNGGAELGVPTSQASIKQTTQTSRQTGAIQERLSQPRYWPAGAAVAGGDLPRTGQIAALNTRIRPDKFFLRKTSRSNSLIRPACWECSPMGGQFGSRDMATSVNGYSFNNAGFVAGADYRFTPQLAAGIAFGYSQSNTNFDTSAVQRSRSIPFRQSVSR